MRLISHFVLLALCNSWLEYIWHANIEQLPKIKSYESYSHFRLMLLIIWSPATMRLKEVGLTKQWKPASGCKEASQHRATADHVLPWQQPLAPGYEHSKHMMQTWGLHIQEPRTAKQMWNSYLPVVTKRLFLSVSCLELESIFLNYMYSHSKIYIHT